MRSRRHASGDARKADTWRPLPDRSARAMEVAGLAMVVIGLVVIAAVVIARGYPGAGRGAPFDVIKTATGVVLGGFALRFAVRQLRVKELTLQEARDEASDRRRKELYDAAAEFGEAEPGVRLAHLHALEERARGGAVERRYLVKVLCSYLRMPFKGPSEIGSADAEHYEQWKKDCQVRMVAQGVLAAQLRLDNEDSSDGWCELDIDLTGAVLIDFDLSGCRCRTSRFDTARFEGNVDFRAATFTDVARFTKATFMRDALFEGVRFVAGTEFEGAICSRYATFHGAEFCGQANFNRTVFSGHTVFDSAVFIDKAIFDGTQFRGATGFVETRFADEVGFGGAVFATVEFDRVNFDLEGCSGSIAFGGAIFAEGVPVELVRFLEPLVASPGNADGTCDD